MHTVLIVEDEYLLRSELALCVDWQSLGFDTPLTAEDGEAGLTMALTHRPDVILTDIRMPRMDGLKMLRAIKQEGLQAVCIVLSAYDDFSYAVEAMRYGVMDYLLKPPDDARLAEVLREAARRLDESAAETPPLRPEEENAGNLYLKKADEYLEKHYAEDIRLTDVAESLFISDAYLGRLYVRYYRKKFTDVLAQLRIRKAIPLLRDPRYKIYQVAQMVGYRNQQYFGSVFRKLMGLSPYQFRHSLGIRGSDDE